MAKCKHCGCEFDPERFMDRENAIYSVKEYCFGCSFWLPKVDARKRQDPCCVVVNGWHYFIGEETGHRGLGAGHGGAKFTIKFHDGRTVVSTNLWCQGEIDEPFKELLPDNATFVKEATRPNPPNEDGLPF